jgi:hypothetical protein
LHYAVDDEPSVCYLLCTTGSGACVLVGLEFESDYNDTLPDRK